MANENIKPTITTETSKKFSVNMPDFLRSTLTGLFTAVSAVVLQFLDAWITAISTNANFTFDKVSFLLALKVAIAAWLGDMLRRFLKSSATVIRVKPGLKQATDDDDSEGSDRPPVPPIKPDPEP